MTTTYLQLPTEATRLIETVLDKSEVYLVGGLVRDHFMGLQDGRKERGNPKDIDLAFNCDTNALMVYLKSEGFHVVETGLDFGVFQVNLLDGVNVDLAHFRAETYSKDSRKPTTTPVKTIEEDLARRDFTFNAIAMRALGLTEFEIIDPYGGIADIEHAVVRAVGAPIERYEEDPLRMFRALRFAARYEFTIDEATFHVIPALLDRLSILSSERISEELLKGLSQAVSPSIYFDLLMRSGVLPAIIPEFALADGISHDTRGSHHNESLTTHTREALDRLDTENPIMRLAVMLHDIGKVNTRTFDGVKIRFVGHDAEGAKIVRERLRALRFSNETVNFVATLIQYHMDINNLRGHSIKVIRRKLARLFVELREDQIIHSILSLCEADTGDDLTFMMSQVSLFTTADKGLGGRDVTQYKPALRGKILRQMRYLQLYQRLSHDDLLAILAGEAHNVEEAEV